MTWLLAALSITGTILNIRRRRECFLLWMITNCYWAVMGFRAALPAEGAMFICYFGLSIAGFISWSGGKKQNPAGREQ